MTIHIDAELENADWVKQTWDFPGVPDSYWETTAPQAELEILAANPAFAAAPARVRAIIESRLAEVADS